MNIYEAEGSDAIVDLRAAAHELKSSTSITNDGVRRQVIAEISTAALLDIALSLRVVAAEARAAMPTLLTGELDETPVEDEPRDFLVEGDLVIVEGMDEPGEIIRFGTTEGAIYAVVQLANGAEVRPWLDSLTRLSGDEGEPDDETVERIVDVVAEASAFTSAEIEAGILPVESEDVVDDIDDDFKGEATTALDTLKAAKKSGKKGSKK